MLHKKKIKWWILLTLLKKMGKSMKSATRFMYNIKLSSSGDSLLPYDKF